MNWVFEHSDATGNDRLVLLALADEADDEGKDAYPSVQRVATKARVPKPTVLRCLKRLEEAGRLRVIRPETRGRGRFNRYELVLENGREVTPFPGSTEDNEMTQGTVQKGPQRSTPVANPNLTHRPIDPETLLPPSAPPPSEPVAPRPPRKRTVNDDVWDALVEVCGWTPRTPTEKSRLGKVVRALVSVEATGEEVRRRAREYRRRWRGVDLTPEALEKHWSTMAPAAPTEDPKPSDERDFMGRPMNWNQRTEVVEAPEPE